VRETGDQLKDHRGVGDSRQDGRRGRSGDGGGRFRPPESRGGKRKRLYTLLPAGERALARVYESLRLMAGGVGARLRALKE